MTSNISMCSWKVNKTRHNVTGRNFNLQKKEFQPTKEGISTYKGKVGISTYKKR